METAGGLADEDRKEHWMYSVRLLKQLFWWKITPQVRSDDDPSDFRLDTPGFADALRSALKPHLIRPCRNKGPPEFVTKLAAQLWSAEEMPKAKENQQEGENTPRDDKEKSGDLAAGASSVDAGDDLANPLGDNMFKEGESVICSAKKMKQFYDGQTATIMRFMPRDRVKIKMTSGGKTTRFVLWMRRVSARTRRRRR